jgi:hypothetical protein
MDSDEFDDDDFASGVFSFKDLKALGIVKDRPDLHRKQKLYGFPRMIKTGERQAGTFRRPVYRWLKKRAAITAASEERPGIRACDAPRSREHD